MAVQSFSRIRVRTWRVILESLTRTVSRRDF
jgi:hypothetical protein